MKAIFFLLATIASIATMATQPEPPVYYTGNNERAASTGVVTPDSLQTVTPAVGARHDLPATGRVHTAADTVLLKQAGCKVYYTGNGEPAAFGLFRNN